MPAKVTPGLDELRSQARRTFRYWPIYLMLRLREVEQHLTPAQHDELGPVVGFDSSSVAASLPALPSSDGRLALLVEYGLLRGDEPAPDRPVSPISLPAADEYIFRSGAALIGSQMNTDWVSLDFVMRQSTTLVRKELLQTAAVYTEVVARAAEVFNRMNIDLSAEVAFEAAHFYVLMHGARVMDWQPVPRHIVRDFLPDGFLSGGSEPVLPPRRRRGRGIFRTPN